MTKSSIVFKMGTRSSNLAVLQSRKTLNRFEELFPEIKWELINCSSPGDRDRKTDLRDTPGNYFTKDLDDLVLDGQLDCAIHSAKDLPYPLPEDIDWFWLPWREDPRDVIILPKGKTMKDVVASRQCNRKHSPFYKGGKGDFEFELVDKNHPALKRTPPRGSTRDVPPKTGGELSTGSLCSSAATHEELKIGVSSERREKYCKQHFPKAELLTIRGNIEDRISQLDAGKYDMIIMAAAALQRLNLQNRITQWISLKNLPTPEGQGTLALTFKKNDKRFLSLRSLFVKSVTFAGAGVGTADLYTTASLKAIQNCDICLHDHLQDRKLLDELPQTAKCICVGKRSGQHSVSQKEITGLIADYARKGYKVVRLKAGDPCIFGRLAEETEELEQLRLPYTVIPGISSISAATAGTGMMLTRRNISHGFAAMTPRKAGGGIAPVNNKARAELPIVFFMSINTAHEVVEELIKDGLSHKTPAAVVFGAYSDNEIVLRGNLENICEKIQETKNPKNPGLLIIGEPAKYCFDKTLGAYAGRKILLTCSSALQDRAAGIVRDFGGIPIQRPLIKLTLNDDVAASSPPENVAANEYKHSPFCKGGLGGFQFEDYDWIVMTSPSSVRCFLELLKKAKVDLRKLPKIMVCGDGTKKELERSSVFADAAPEFDFGATGILKTAQKIFVPGQKILRLRSDKAGTTLADKFRKLDVIVDDRILYHNEIITYDNCPEFDAVFFASASAVEAFDNLWGSSILNNKTILTIGKPTKKLLEEKGITETLTGSEATVEASLFTLATEFVRQALL